MIQASQRRVQILSGRTHPGLAQEIARRLDITLGRAQLGNFANGEISVRLDESIRGSDVFIIQTHGGPNVNQSIMEQVLMIDAAKRASARSVTAVCPLLGYARQDRKASGREPIAARIIIDMLASAGANRIMSVDLHSGQTQGFFDGPFDHLIAMPVLRSYVKKHFDSDIVVVSPDAGGVKTAERYSSALGCELAIVHKHRSTSQRNKVEAKYLIGDVDGRVCIIVDDMIDTAGTICAAADLLSQNGAQAIYGLATHGILSDPAQERIEQSAFTKVIVTNTVPLAPGATTKVESISVAPIIADAIAAVFGGQSVSAIFEGKNQI